MAELKLPEGAQVALSVGNTHFAIRLTLATYLSELADQLLVLAGLEDTGAGKEAYSVAQALVRDQVRTLFA